MRFEEEINVAKNYLPVILTAIKNKNLEGALSCVASALYWLERARSGFNSLVVEKKIKDKEFDLGCSSITALKNEIVKQTADAIKKQKW